MKCEKDINPGESQHMVERKKKKKAYKWRINSGLGSEVGQFGHMTSDLKEFMPFSLIKDGTTLECCGGECER